jgi:hypothetical protein
MWLATAILSTIAVALSGAYAILSPTTLKIIALVLFTIACTLNWVELSLPKRPSGQSNARSKRLTESMKPSSLASRCEPCLNS